VIQIVIEVLPEFMTMELSCRFLVATGHPSFGDISEIHFLQSIQSPAQMDLNGMCNIAGIYCDL